MTKMDALMKEKKKKRSKLERKGANFISKIEVLPERCELLMLKVENLMPKNRRLCWRLKVEIV